MQAESFILVPATVTDLDDFVARPEAHLVSTLHAPGRAARLWWERAQRHPYGSEGLVQIRYRGHELIAPDLWDDVSGIWFEILEVLEEHLAGRPAERLFPGQPVPITLRRKDRSTLFTVGSTTTVVDPADFLPELLDAVIEWFTWVEQHIGDGQGETLARAHDLRADLPFR